jgi:hypothetical protein
MLLLLKAAMLLVLQLLLLLAVVSLLVGLDKPVLIICVVCLWGGGRGRLLLTNPGLSRDACQIRSRL